MARVSPHLLIWHEDRAKYVRLKLEEELTPGTWTAVDISAATAAVRLRIWKGPTLSRAVADALWNEEMDIDSDGSGGADAIVSDMATIVSGSGRVGPIELEVVLIDEAVGSQPTPSTFQERVLLSWGSAEGAKLLPSIQP